LYHEYDEVVTSSDIWNECTYESSVGYGVYEDAKNIIWRYNWRTESDIKDSQILAEEENCIKYLAVDSVGNGKTLWTVEAALARADLVIDAVYTLLESKEDYE
jgi:hypothetical protein